MSKWREYSSISLAESMSINSQQCWGDVAAALVSKVSASASRFRRCSAEASSQSSAVLSAGTIAVSLAASSSAFWAQSAASRSLNCSPLPCDAAASSRSASVSLPSARSDAISSARLWADQDRELSRRWCASTGLPASCKAWTSVTVAEAGRCLAAPMQSSREAS